MLVKEVEQEVEDVKVEVKSVDENYLAQIEELKKKMETMVPGEEYDKVLEEHRKITEDYINKRTPEKTEVELKPAAEYAKKLIKNEDMSNLEFVKTSLEYRQAFMKETGKDPWSNDGVDGKEAEQVAEHLQALVDEYGDSASEFNFRFTESLVDDPALVTKLNKERRKRK